MIRAGGPADFVEQHRSQRQIGVAFGHRHDRVLLGQFGEMREGRWPKSMMRPSTRAAEELIGIEQFDILKPVRATRHHRVTVGPCDRLRAHDQFGIKRIAEVLHDGASYEMFLDRVQGHARACLLYDPSHFVLQQLDYLDYIEIYHEHVRAFHVKDAEFAPSGRQGVYGGYQPWVDRAGRFRSLGDRQVDFGRVFSQLSAHDFDGWAVLEWECALKHSEDGAREGAEFIAAHIIPATDHAFDDFAGAGTEESANRRILGLG